MLHVVSEQGPKPKSTDVLNHSEGAKIVLLKLGVMWTLLGVVGAGAGLLMSGGYYQAGVLMGFGNLMLCLGLAIAVLSYLTDRWNEALSGGEKRAFFSSPSETLVSFVLVIAITAIMWPFLRSAMAVGFSNISVAEQYALVAVGMGLLAALGSLFYEGR